MDDTFTFTKANHTLSIGRLGATVSCDMSEGYMRGVQLDMIERRILRIEAALQQAGIVNLDVDTGDA